jgi:hypothetical protein
MVWAVNERPAVAGIENKRLQVRVSRDPAVAKRGPIAAARTRTIAEGR